MSKSKPKIKPLEQPEFDTFKPLKQINTRKERREVAKRLREQDDSYYEDD